MAIRDHGIAIDVLHFLFVLRVTHEHFHFVGGVTILQNDGMLFLVAMVFVEQFLAEVLHGLKHNLPRDYNVGHIVAGTVHLSGVERFETH